MSLESAYGSLVMFLMTGQGSDSQNYRGINLLSIAGEVYGRTWVTLLQGLQHHLQLRHRDGSWEECGVDQIADHQLLLEIDCLTALIATFCHSNYGGH